MNIYIGNTVEDYRQFLKIKTLPRYEIVGRMATVPDEYAETLGIKSGKSRKRKYAPRAGLFDYQRAIVEMAIAKKRFAIFADCALAKLS